MLHLILVVTAVTLVSILFLAKYPSSSGRSRVIERAGWYVFASFFVFTTTNFGVKYGAPAEYLRVVLVFFCGVSIVTTIWHVKKAFRNLVKHMVRIEKKSPAAEEAGAYTEDRPHRTRRMTHEEGTPTTVETAHASPGATEAVQAEAPSTVAEIATLHQPRAASTG